VFSENYFNFVAHTAKYKRDDIKHIMDKLQKQSNLSYINQ